MKSRKSIILYSCLLGMLFGCSHPKSIVGEYVCNFKPYQDYRHYQHYLRLNKDSTFFYNNMLGVILCGSIKDILPYTGHWHTNSDSIVLIYDVREASEYLSPSDSTIWMTDSTGLTLPESLMQEECREISRDSLPIKVVFYNRSGIYNDKIQHLYRHKYSKTSPANSLTSSK